MPNKGMKFPPEILTRSEISDIASTFSPRSGTGIRNRALFFTYLRAQLRCNEALDLLPTDIDFDRSSILVRNGKGGRRRLVGMDENLLSEIKKWSEKRASMGLDNTSRAFFCTLRGGRMVDSYVRKMVKRHAARAGVRGRVHVHGLRHSGATFLADAGVDIRVISKQLGHSSSAVTSRYIDHLTGREAIEVVSQLNW